MRKKKTNQLSDGLSFNPYPSIPVELIKESDIKRDIIEYLEIKKVMTWVNHSTGIFNKKTGWRKMNGKGTRKGTSDIFCLPFGKFCAIEVKKPGGVLSDDQRKFISDVRAAGHIAFVAYSVRDVARELFNE